MKHLGWIGLLTLALVMLAGEVFAGTVQQAGTNAGRAVSRTRLATGVSTNTTSTVSVIPPGFKTFLGQLRCATGTCVQVQAVYGALTEDAIEGVLLCTLALSASLVSQDVCAGATADYPFYYVITTGTTGTSPVGTLDVIY
jgi:hypothetical protein